MTIDTTAPSYWLNWRFLLCAIWVIVAMVISSLIISRNECRKKSKNRDRTDGNQRDPVFLYKGEAWGTSLKLIHPICLLAYRIVAFCAMLALILADSIVHGVGIFYFYTQWTFTLVTIYFGLASAISVYGCLYNRHKVDFEQGSYVAPSSGEDADMHSNNRILNQYDDPNFKTASVWEYSFQIIFQMCCGAVALTDSVFWLVLYPFYFDKDSTLTFLIICMHSVNAVFLLGDITLNSLRFPFFRIAYFALWTCVFVVFQWILHAFDSRSWPYAFLDLSSPYAPLWYLGVGLLHFPCFGIFTLIFKIKQLCLSRIASGNDI